MTKPAPKPTDVPAGQSVELTVNVLTDGLGRYYVPVFAVFADGTAACVGVDVFDGLEAALRDGGDAPDA